MTPEQSAWLRARIADGVRYHDELVAKKQSLADWPRSAFADPPALLVYCDTAMYAYYLGPEGEVYQLDLDRFAQVLDRIGNPDTIRRVYATASDKFAELGDINSA